MNVRPENYRERCIKDDVERRLLFALMSALSEIEGVDALRLIERVTSTYLGLGPDWVPLPAAKEGTDGK